MQFTQEVAVLSVSLQNKVRRILQVNGVEYFIYEEIN